MKKRYKQILSIFMLVMVSALNIKVGAEEVPDINLIDRGRFMEGFTYNVVSEKEKTCAITGYTNDIVTNIIPDEIDGYKVVAIEDNAFNGNKRIAGQVTIPDSVKYIGKDSFRDIKYLTSVILGKGTKEIKDRAFYNCIFLEQVNLSNVEKIGNEVWYKCNNFKEKTLTMPDTLKSIGSRAFAFSNLEKIVFTSQVDPITQDDTFAYYDKTIVIPATQNNYKQSIWNSALIGGERRLGDLDNDGVTNANDAAVALKLYNYGGVTEEDLLYGDMDRDGIINANDAALILKVYNYGY